MKYGMACVARRASGRNENAPHNGLNIVRIWGSMKGCFDLLEDGSLFGQGRSYMGLRPKLWSAIFRIPYVGC